MSVIEISSGGNHFLCLDQEGNIHSCGNCEHGQLGRINSYNLERGGRRGIGKRVKQLNVTKQTLKDLKCS